MKVQCKTVSSLLFRVHLRLKKETGWCQGPRSQFAEEYERRKVAELPDWMAEGLLVVVSHRHLRIAEDSKHL